MNVNRFNHKKNDNEDINNILCPLCFSKMLFKYINQNNKIFFCSNNKCIFPMNHIEMEKFIFHTNKDNINEFISKIKKIVFEMSLSNDTNYEERIRPKIKEEFKINIDNLVNSDIISNDDKQHFFDSFSESYNLNIE